MAFNITVTEKELAEAIRQGHLVEIKFAPGGRCWFTLEDDATEEDLTPFQHFVLAGRGAFNENVDGEGI